MVARKARPSKLLNLKTSPEEQKVMYVSRTSHLSLNTDQYTQTIDTAKPSTPRHLRYSVYRQNCVAVSTIISSPASPSTFAQQRTGMAARDANTSSTCAKLPTTTKRHLYATSSAAVLISNGTFQDVRSTSHTTRQSTLWPSVLGFQAPAASSTTWPLSSPSRRLASPPSPDATSPTLASSASSMHSSQLRPKPLLVFE